MPIVQTGTTTQRRQAAPFVPLRDFASLCAGIYAASLRPPGTNFFRVGGVTQQGNGFQGAIYRDLGGSAISGIRFWAVAIAGTQVARDLGIDVIADAGFGSSAFGSVASAVNPVFGGVASGLTVSVLSQQCAAAQSLLNQARGLMGPLDKLFITGHSLGGGIAQIVSAATGVPAVAISSPAVTGVNGVADSWARSHSPIVCLKVRHDPVNETHLLGDLLGRVVTLNSSRFGLAAHSIDNTVAELSPQGAFKSIGAADPFSL